MSGTIFGDLWLWGVYVSFYEPLPFSFFVAPRQSSNGGFFSVLGASRQVEILDVALKNWGVRLSSFLSLSCGRSCGLGNLLGSEFCQPGGGVMQANWHCAFYPFIVAGLTFCGSWSAGTSQLDSRALTKIFLSVDCRQISVSVGE